MEILYRGHVTWKHRKLAFARNIYIYNIYNIYIIYITYIYIYIKLKNSSSTAFSQTGFSEVFYKVKFIRPNQL